LKSRTQYRIMHVIFKRGEHSAHVTAKLLWCTVLNCGGMLCYRMAASGSCVCAYFVAALFGRVLCMERKNGFTDGCKWQYVNSDVA
jgi:uncharacterized membrane protein HdeD (DUF308 family)